MTRSAPGVFRLALTRRGLLQGLACATLVAALQTRPTASAAPPITHVDRLLVWLEFASDGTTTLVHTTTELGQGTPSTLAQIVADQLDVPWQSVRLRQAPLEAPFVAPGDYYGTSSSSGVRTQFEDLQTLGATARVQLIAAAARAWRVPPERCDTAAGHVIGPEDGQRAPYATLVAAAAALPLPPAGSVAPRPGRLLGTSPPRLGVLERVTGTATYGIDVRRPGLVHAAIELAPAPGARLLGAERDAARRTRGVIDLIELDEGIAVLARDTWSAQQGLSALAPRWDVPEGVPSLRDVRARLRAAVHGPDGRLAALDPSQPPAAAREHAAATLARATRRVVADYETPFAAHQTLEPQNATADVRADGVDVWVPTQHQSLVRQAVADALGRPPASVAVHTTAVGGGFGRRLEADVPVLAARLAARAGRPVKLLWSRAQDVRHDYYRPAAAARLQAALDDSGAIAAWTIDVAGPSILASSGSTHEVGADGVDFTSLMGLALPYSLPRPSVRWTEVQAPVRVGWWRSVGSSSNVFFVESFLDEVAATLGTTPLHYRRRLLPAGSRGRAVLEALVRIAALEREPPQGRTRGLAMVRMSDTIAAEAVEISVDGDRVTVHDVYVAFDCGRAIDPSSVRAQVEGSVLWGLSACLLEEITFERGAVAQSNFHDYPLTRLAQAPRISVELIDGGAPLGGAGEEAVPPVAPALAAALHAATGRRFRELPFARAGLRLG